MKKPYRGRSEHDRAAALHRSDGVFLHEVFGRRRLRSLERIYDRPRLLELAIEEFADRLAKPSKRRKPMST
jgi:hypothetical protein